MSGIGFLVTWKCDQRFIEYKLNERKVLDRIHAKVGDRNLCILGGLFTIEIDGDDRLISRDVFDWWVAGAISGESYRDNHLTGRSSALLI